MKARENVCATRTYVMNDMWPNGSSTPNEFCEFFCWQVEQAGQVVNFMDYATAFQAALACKHTRASRFSSSALFPELTVVDRCSLPLAFPAFLTSSVSLFAHSFQNPNNRHIKPPKQRISFKSTLTPDFIQFKLHRDFASEYVYFGLSVLCGHGLHLPSSAWGCFLFFVQVGEDCIIKLGEDNLLMKM
jgi:hypothetical protein